MRLIECSLVFSFVFCHAFLVGAFSFQGKMPDAYSDLFISDLTLIGSLFTETTKTTQIKSGQGKLSAKGPPFIFYFLNVTYKTRTRLKGPLLIFFRHCATFLENFYVSKGSPSSCLIFCNRMYVNKSQCVPLFFIFRHYATFSEKDLFVLNKMFFFVPSWGKVGFRVLSSMKGTLWGNCFLSFS